MPYARSAPTADAAHYEQDRALQWQREKQIRKDAARRRKLRAQSNEKRQAAETERAQNEYAERKHKKLEYVKYLRSQLRKRRQPKRTPREPTQYEVEERRKEASKRRAVQAREREAARRTDALAAATAAARALARKNARRAQDADSVARTAPPMGACPTTRSSCGDLAAPGLDGTQPWSAVADAAAARLQRRIDRGKQAQEALSRRHEQHVASICDSPASTMLFQAWREEAAAAVERGQAAAAAPAPATNNEVWSKRLDHAPSTLFSSLDLSLNERQKASLPPQPKVGGYGAIHAAKATTPPKKVYAKRGEGLDTPTTGYARRAALKGRTPPQRTPSSGAPTTASSRRTRQKKPKPASPKERWGAGGRQTAAEREKELLRKRKADFAARQRLKNQQKARRKAQKSQRASASTAATSVYQKPLELQKAPAPMPCERSPDLPVSQPKPRRKAPVDTALISVEERDVAKSLRRLDGLIQERLKRRQKPTKPAWRPPSPLGSLSPVHESPARRPSPRRRRGDARSPDGWRRCSPVSDASPSPRRRRREDRERRRAPTQREWDETPVGGGDAAADFENAARNMGSQKPRRRHLPDRPPLPDRTNQGEGLVVQTSLAYLLE